MKRWSPVLSILALVLLAVLPYARLWHPSLATTPMFYDASLTIDSLRSIHHPQAYLDAIVSGRHADVQPLRDLLFWVELKLSALAGDQVFLLTSLMLLFGLTAAFHRFLRLIHILPAAALIASAYLATHPLTTQVVPWIVAQKHLLAALLIMLATSAQTPMMLWLNYSAALLAQPIHLLWPLHALIKGRMRTLLPLLALIFTMLTVAALNWWYYRGPYLLSAGASKFASEFDLLLLLNALGRNFVQLLWPYQLAFSYAEDSLSNVLGLGALILWHLLLLKKLTLRRALLILTLYWPTQLLTNLMPNNIFVSDSYLLLPLVAWVLSLVLLVPPQRLVAIGLGLVLFHSVLNTMWMERWQDPARFWRFSYEHQDSCINHLQHTRSLWHQHALAEAMAESKLLIKRRCALTGNVYQQLSLDIFILSLMNDPELTSAQRQQQLERLPLQENMKEFLLHLAQDVYSAGELAQEAMALKLNPREALLLPLKKKCLGQSSEACSTFFQQQ